MNYQGQISTLWGGVQFILVRSDNCGQCQQPCTNGPFVALGHPYHCVMHRECFFTNFQHSAGPPAIQNS